MRVAQTAACLPSSWSRTLGSWQRNFEPYKDQGETQTGGSHPTAWLKKKGTVSLEKTFGVRSALAAR